MTTELAMRRDGNRLAPVDPVSDEELCKLPLNREFLVSVKTPRNIRQFRLAWALATKVADACDFLQDREDGMNWLKIRSRHVKMLQDPKTGMVAIVPKSIAFASLSQDAFKRLFDRMVYVTVSEIIPGLKETDLRREIAEMVGA